MARRRFRGGTVAPLSVRVERSRDTHRRCAYPDGHLDFARCERIFLGARTAIGRYPRYHTPAFTPRPALRTPRSPNPRPARRLNPQATDPVQQQVFKIMPWLFMFIMAPFAAGLLLYWITNNILSIAQQQWMYRKFPALRSEEKTSE